MSRSMEELKELAFDLLAGRIITSDYVAENDPNMMQMVFMGLSLMTEAQVQELRDAGVSLLYEHIDKSLPRSINGMPCFLSFNTMTRDEHVKLYELAQKLKEALDNVGTDDDG